MTTALAVEAYGSNIEIEWDNAKIIEQVDKEEHKYLIEALEIVKRQKDEKLVNNKVTGIPKPWEYAMKT